MRILYHNNAWPHISKYAQNFLNKKNITLIAHPAYSLDLVPYDFWLFLTITRELQGQQFSSDEEVTNPVPVFLRGLSSNEFEKTIITKCEGQMRKCVVYDGQYFEKEPVDSDSK